jgi:sulfur relay (sulfurtransferase) DsrF/TusC family protein
LSGAAARQRIGLLVRSGPFAGRSARDQLDIALAAATLDFDLDLFFVDEGVLLISGGDDPHGAGLPRGTKGWKSLPGLTAVRSFAAADDWERLGGAGVGWLLDVRPVSPEDMAAFLAKCRRVLVV